MAALLLLAMLTSSLLCVTVGSAGPVVKTEYGPVEGFVNDSMAVNVNVFHGV